MWASVIVALVLNAVGTSLAPTSVGLWLRRPAEARVGAASTDGGRRQ
jgi:hypothetical protein